MMLRLGLLLAVLLSVGSPGGGYAQEAILYDGGERRDPLAPLVGEGGIVNYSKDTADINIEGIVFDPNAQSLVLINDEFYKEGERVKNANIISILKDRVILEQDSEQKTLWIREEIAENLKQM